MFRTTAAFVLLGSLPLLPAQQSLTELQQRFAQEARALGDDPSYEDIQALQGRQLAALRAFVGSAAGDDRWNGRLMLADFELAQGDRKAAAATLRTIDAAAAPALVLVTGAAMALHLELEDLRTAWVAAALGKTAPRADRLAMARILSTVLKEVDAATRIYEAELAAAETDEDRALVRWHRADALRDREDLHDNAGFEELQRLADELPGTYWGSVARDRLRATQLRPGDPAIAFRATLRDGTTVDSKDLAGKAVVLLFWSGADRDLPRLLDTLRPLQQRHGDKVYVLGICLDRDVARSDADRQRLGLSFPTVADGKGIETDVALRWFVEGPVVHVLDANGKVAGLGLHAGTGDARADLVDIIGRAVGR
ncbi:MAG: redoxin domain-containing protein [Planctomycetes bacterium]|nr:redoxin domain-containing protein [Planctomycetota bacterium]